MLHPRLMPMFDGPFMKCWDGPCELTMFRLPDGAKPEKGQFVIVEDPYRGDWKLGLDYVWHWVPETHTYRIAENNELHYIPPIGSPSTTK